MAILDELIKEMHGFSDSWMSIKPTNSMNT